MHRTVSYQRVRVVVSKNTETCTALEQNGYMDEKQGPLGVWDANRSGSICVNLVSFIGTGCIRRD